MKLQFPVKLFGEGFGGDRFSKDDCISDVLHSAREMHSALSSFENSFPQPGIFYFSPLRPIVGITPGDLNPKHVYEFFRRLPC